VVPQEVDAGLGVSVQVLVPLQVTVMQAVSVQATAVPVQVVPEQASLNVHGSPSLHRKPVRHCQMPPSLVQR
jgi:hypothetical protein